MGLHTGGDRPTGLATLLLEDSPPRDHKLHRLNVARLESSLEEALKYVVGGNGGSGSGGGSFLAPLPPLVRGGQIDFQAVEQHVQQALQVAAGLGGAAQPPEAQAARAEVAVAGAASEVPAAAVQPASVSGISEAAPGISGSSSGGSAAGGGGSSGSASPEQPPPLEADSPAGSPLAPAAPPAAAPAPCISSGRLGPDEVTLVEARGTCEIRGCNVMSRTNFSTVRSSVCVWKGRWMYEAQLGTAGIIQLGWTTLQARFNSEEGVGDNQDSYAYDGRRKMRWHVSNAAYGERWAAGDTIGCCIDLDAGSMRYLRNGKDLGEAFADVRRGMPGAAYFCGVSLSYGERCELNFGGRPFLHPVEGYQPLQQQPVLGVPHLEHLHEQVPAGEARQRQVAAASYLAGCLSRLIQISSPAPAAAAAAAASEGAPAAEPEAGSKQEEQEQAAAAEAWQEEAHLLAGASAPRPAVGGRLLPDADVLAALAALAGGEAGNSKGAAVAGLPFAPSAPSLAADGGGPAIRMDDRVLLGAVLAQYLGPLCLDRYIVETVLVDLLDETAGELASGSSSGSGGASGGDGERAAEDAWAASGWALYGTAAATVGASGEPAAVPAVHGVGDCQELGRQQLQQLLDLLAAVLEAEELAALASTCCQVLARRVRGSVWSLVDMPASAALSALRLWGAMLDCADVRAAWLASDQWEHQLEQLLTVWQPSEDDLTELLCNLKVVWSEEGAGVVRNRREDQSLFAKDLGKLTEGLEQVEAAQADLLLQLWLEPGSGDAQGQAPRGPYLRRFLAHLVYNNRNASMHIPPPGLSDVTCLVSAAFALLRLMNEQVSAGLPSVPSLRWDPLITFLQGGPLGGGSDPYFDAGRLGGTLSHLAREHPPTEEDRQALEELPLGAVVKYDSPLRLREHALQGPSFSDVWLRDRLLVLCHVSAAPLMRGSLSHLASMQAAMAGLCAVSASVEEGGGSRMLDQTRRECQQEFSRGLRSHEWAQCWLLSPWRQQAAFVLSVATAQLVEAVAEQRDGLLRYVPELYISSLLDMVHAVHRCEPAVLDHEAMLGLGLRHIVEFVVAHLEDERIVSPEVQSRLMHMVLEGVQELDLLRELGINPVARRRLLPAMMRLFGRPHLWGQASNFFALLVEGCGLLHPPAAFPSDFSAPVAALRGLFKDACLADADLCARFLHHLFDHVNRMLTELVASLESMDSAWGRNGAGQPSAQHLRLLTSTADYALVLLRTLELLAGEMPQLFLEGGDMNMQRLAEVLGFALPQFVSGRARRALERLAANRLLSQQLRLRNAHLLQPLAGLLVALWEAEQQQEAGQHGEGEAGGSGSGPGSSKAALEAGAGSGSSGDGGAASWEAAAPPGGGQEQGAAQGRQPRRRNSLLRALGRQAALTDDVLRGLRGVELAQVEPLSAEAAAAAADRPEPPLGVECRVAADVQRLTQAVSALVAAREAAAASAGGRGGAGGGDGGQVVPGGEDAEVAEVPEEYLDPILATLMQDPVLLPDSRTTLDRSTIERHLMSSSTDPFSRAPLSKEQLISNHELRQQIEAWLQQHPHHSHSHHS